MNYSQFLNMCPEVFLTAMLVVVFVWDFCISGKRSREDSAAASTLHWGVCLMMLAYTVFAFFTIGDRPEGIALFGGMYVSTPASGVMKTILGAGTLIVLLQARQWLLRPDTVARQGEFHMLVVSTLLGMNVMMSAGHFLMFFLGLEMASVPMACLVALDKWRRHSAEGAAKYILMATFSSGVMLYGISLIYGATGHLYFANIMPTLQGNGRFIPIAVVGMVFFMSGLAFKLSLVPFHYWTADTYQGAPTTVTGYLSVISKGAAAFALCTILGKVLAPIGFYWAMVLCVLIVLSITVANLFAIRQTELKRFMAFSSISQAGYIMLAVLNVGSYGVASLSYYVLVYIVANLAVFSVIGAVEQQSGRTDMSAYNGLYATNPRLSLLMTLALFSLAGIPPFAGMFSKFFVFMAAVQHGSFIAYFVVFIALINTVVSLYYYLLIVKAMYIKSSEQALPCFRTDTGTRLALLLCTAGILLLGVCSGIYEWIFMNAA